jgi:acetylornithine/succinyldiaminopimelate/putrescine aminotransferase
MEAEDVPARARRAGARLTAGLERLDGVASVRGHGLLLGAVLESDDAVAVTAAALAAGLVVNAPRPDTIRLAPSLLVTDEEIDEAVAILATVLS